MQEFIQIFVPFQVGLQEMVIDGLMASHDGSKLQIIIAALQALQYKTLQSACMCQQADPRLQAPACELQALTSRGCRQDQDTLVPEESMQLCHFLLVQGNYMLLIQLAKLLTLSCMQSGHV